VEQHAEAGNCAELLILWRSVKLYNKPGVLRRTRRGVDAKATQHGTSGCNLWLLWPVIFMGV